LLFAVTEFVVTSKR